MKEIKKNNINILLEDAPKTPRTCVSLFFKIDKKEKYYGLNSLMARLLVQGTKKYTSEKIASIFENECIDLSFKAKQDYIKATLVFLNEDFNLAAEMIKDLILNSTFEEFEKEKFKFKNEIISDLDSPRFKLSDSFIKNIFENHPYASTHTKILETIDDITKQDVIEAHQKMLNSKKAIVFTGVIENENELVDYFADNFDFMANAENNAICEIEDNFDLNIKEDKIIFIEKNDAEQAQILQGILVPSYNDEKMSAKIAVLNNILGSSGLSSRLFVNLRDKKGLAYTVRSQYETLLHSAIFNMYIGTHPKNIQKSLDGFIDELTKLYKEPVSTQELIGAKENISGRLKYFSQNNSQIAAINGYNYTMGLGLDYNEKFMKEINLVTADDIQTAAKMILDKPKLTVIIAPESYRV